MNQKSLLTPGLLALFGLIILGYMWRELGDKGLKADANGTSGSLTLVEMALLLLGFSLLVASLVVVLRLCRRRK